jgi:hypothetical protein
MFNLLCNNHLRLKLSFGRRQRTGALGSRNAIYHKGEAFLSSARRRCLSCVASGSRWRQRAAANQLDGAAILSRLAISQAQGKR